ncbi:preprotein translocase subunit SecA [Patescibacteria group bacterium]
MSIFSKVFGSSDDKEAKKLEPVVTEINTIDADLDKLSDDELKAKTTEFKQKLKSADDYKAEQKILNAIMPEAFAVVKNACKRLKGTEYEIAGVKEKWHMVPFDEQIIGGIVLHQGQIAEMKTGEGKTLVATMPIYLNALSGRGVHVVTVNEYLATRDAEWMGLVYKYLGLTVGSTRHGQTPKEKKAAYDSDVTYGTNNEFGFDYLRDNMAYDLENKTQRELNYVIVDEVDSILIDEARTPLIISAPDEESGKMYQQFSQMIPRLKEDVHFNIDEKEKAATLTDEGMDKLEEMLGVKNIYTDKGITYVHHLEQALKAHTIFQKDRDYVVKDGEVIIVDQFTGRLMPGRRFSEGLHQAIEAKEGVPVQKESKTLATITFQNYFRLYKKLAGMTGTAKTQEEEFQKVYNLDVAIIPTHKPMVRDDGSDGIYQTEPGKFKAVVKEIQELKKKKQPVLVGTIAIEKSEVLSNMLKRAGVQHEVLNAKHHEKEATIIAKAGQPEAVTIATNMAGRGTDIKLGEGVKELGGLHIMGTERHEARRIDNQLRGRAGRQGDPGSSQFFVSMDDELMRRFGSDRMKAIMNTLKVPEDQPIESAVISKQIEGAQKKVEGHNFDVRRYVLEYDDVMNKHREIMYKRRQGILEAWANEKFKIQKSKFKIADDDKSLPYPGVKTLKDRVLDIVAEEIENVVDAHTRTEVEQDWNTEEIREVMNTVFPIPNDLHQRLDAFRDKGGTEDQDAKAREKMKDYLEDLAEQAYVAKEKAIGYPVMREIERAVLLRTIDSLWIDHLDEMQTLREGIGLRGYGQRNPLVEYKRESYNYFEQLLANIDKQIAYTIYKVKVQLKKPMPMEGAQNVQAGDDTKVAKSKTVKKTKIGRNDPCPCGATKSNGTPKKYKHCHGANA